MKILQIEGMARAFLLINSNPMSRLLSNAMQRQLGLYSRTVLTPSQHDLVGLRSFDPTVKKERQSNMLKITVAQSLFDGSDDGDNTGVPNGDKIGDSDNTGASDGDTNGDSETTGASDGDTNGDSETTGDSDGDKNSAATYEYSSNTINRTNNFFIFSSLWSICLKCFFLGGVKQEQKESDVYIY